MIVRASAPCRLDFAGGWTDVEPYATDRGGAVVNAAIELRATATVELDTAGYRLESLDLGTSATAADRSGLDVQSGLDLLRAAIRFTGAKPCRLVTESAAPPGSGLGSSGAMDVALVAALDHALGRSFSPLETADRAWRVEAIEAGLPGGRQDQYAAALGGFHHFRFSGNTVTARPLALGGDLLAWLESHLVVCYTGQSRVSGNTIARVMGKYRDGDSEVSAALDGLAEAADRMAEALERGEVSAIGRWLSANWHHQQRLDPVMSTPLMARLEHAMASAGALGGKAAGAGAGGSMFFIVGDDPAAAVTEAQRLGVTVLPLTWATLGVRTW
ncbi:MAG: hypothetical protein ACKVZ0_01460 [Gemmatimonadales bacterium]